MKMIANKIVRQRDASNRMDAIFYAMISVKTQQARNSRSYGLRVKSFTYTFVPARTENKEETDKYTRTSLRTSSMIVSFALRIDYKTSSNRKFLQKHANHMVGVNAIYYKM